VHSLRQNRNPKKLGIKASLASYQLTLGCKRRSDVVTACLPGIDNQVTSFPHLVVRQLRLSHSTA
jgi:hypothetical protein